MKEYSIACEDYSLSGVLCMEFLTTKQASALWNVSARRVAILCEQGRINGAVKAGKTWLLPPDAEKPADARIKQNKVVKR
jgi:hypothetical protein